MFVEGQIYSRRRDLHGIYGGQDQGGISTPREHNIIMLFTGDTGSQYGYSDGWLEERVFLYTGEGQKGDMEFVRGNRAIKEHTADGKDLHLFQQEKRGFVMYIGQMVCTGFQYKQAPDGNGKNRKAIVFELAPFNEISQDVAEKGLEQVPPGITLDELRKKALSVEPAAKTPAERKASVLLRSSAIRAYVLKRANGKCEGCGASAPFITEAGRPYLEPHHIRRLSDGGPDHIRWVIALCPNCHRRAHYSEDAGDFNRNLNKLIGKIETGGLNLLG